MLKIEQLNQYYGQSQALWNLDLDVPEGECTVLMGRNGVGKTTLCFELAAVLKRRDRRCARL